MNHDIGHFKYLNGQPSLRVADIRNELGDSRSPLLRGEPLKPYRQNML